MGVWLPQPLGAERGPGGGLRVWERTPLLRGPLGLDSIRAAISGHICSFTKCREGAMRSGLGPPHDGARRTGSLRAPGPCSPRLFSPQRLALFSILPPARCFQPLSHVQLLATPWTAARQTLCPLLTPGVHANPCPLSQ